MGNNCLQPNANNFNIIHNPSYTYGNLRSQSSGIDYYKEYPWSKIVSQILSYWRQSIFKKYSATIHDILYADVLQLIRIFSLNDLIVEDFQSIKFKSGYIYEFSNVLLKRKAILTVNHWNSKLETGGSLHIKVYGAFIMQEKAVIDMDGKGYNGGRGEIQGESYSGLGTKNAQICNDGGGGSSIVYSAIWCITGGGASHASKGNDGICHTSGSGKKYDFQGYAGNCYGPYAEKYEDEKRDEINIDIADGMIDYNCNIRQNEKQSQMQKSRPKWKYNSLLCMGSGGGGAKFAHGGNGGGCIKIECESFVNAGNISADGLCGGGHSKLGGSGSGGSVCIIVNDIHRKTNQFFNNDHHIAFDNSRGYISCVGGESENFIGRGNEGGDGWIEIQIRSSMETKMQVKYLMGNMEPKAHLYISNNSILYDSKKRIFGNIHHSKNTVETTQLFS